MNRPAEQAVRMVDCPTCGGPSRYAADNPWRPFCCAACRDRDLGAWASEDYRVGANPDPELDETPPLQ